MAHSMIHIAEESPIIRQTAFGLSAIQENTSVITTSIKHPTPSNSPKVMRDKQSLHIGSAISSSTSWSKFPERPGEFFGF